MGSGYLATIFQCSNQLTRLYISVVKKKGKEKKFSLYEKNQSINRQTNQIRISLLNTRRFDIIRNKKQQEEESKNAI